MTLPLWRVVLGITSVGTCGDGYKISLQRPVVELPGVVSTGSARLLVTARRTGADVGRCLLPSWLERLRRAGLVLGRRGHREGAHLPAPA